MCLAAAADKINDRPALMMLADAHAAAAENTEIQVAVHEGLRPLHRPLVVCRRHRQLGKSQFLAQRTHLTHFFAAARVTAGRATRFFRFGPELLAKLPPAAHETCTGVFEHHQRQNIAAQILQCLGIRPHDHRVGRRRRA
jgi:hypothetical protein